jgi:hypothetical protein
MVTHDDLRPGLPPGAAGFAERLLRARALHASDPSGARRVLEGLLRESSALPPDDPLPGEELSAGQVTSAARALLEGLR